MPKIIPMVTKMKWLQLHEDEGNSAASIVKGTEGKKPSLKTVNNGIEEARQWRDGKLAHAELLKDALRKHHEQLIAVLGDILSSVQLPAVNLALDLPILLPSAQIIHIKTKGLVLTLDVEVQLEWELLKEHLSKRDPLWAMFNVWKKELKNHIQSWRELSYKSEQVIESIINYKLVDNPADPPFVYSSTTIPFLYDEALNIALGTPPRKSLEERIVVDTDSGEVRDEAGHILAKAPGEEEKCRQKILTAFKDLKESREAKKVTQTHKETEEIIIKLRRIVEEIKLLGIIPGRCRVCKRLGIY